MAACLVRRKLAERPLSVDDDTVPAIRKLSSPVDGPDEQKNGHDTHAEEHDFQATRRLRAVFVYEGATEGTVLDVVPKELGSERCIDHDADKLEDDTCQHNVRSLTLE